MLLLSLFFIRSAHTPAHAPLHTFVWISSFPLLLFNCFLLFQSFPFLHSLFFHRMNDYMHDRLFLFFISLPLSLSLILSLSHSLSLFSLFSLSLSLVHTCPLSSFSLLHLLHFHFLLSPLHSLLFLLILFFANDLLLEFCT